MWHSLNQVRPKLTKCLVCSHDLGVWHAKLVVRSWIRLMELWEDHLTKRSHGFIFLCHKLAMLVKQCSVFLRTLGLHAFKQTGTLTIPDCFWLDSSRYFDNIDYHVGGLTSSLISVIGRPSSWFTTVSSLEGYYLTNFYRNESYKGISISENSFLCHHTHNIISMFSRATSPLNAGDNSLLF
jgi:hypothetical protein